MVAGPVLCSIANVAGHGSQLGALCGLCGKDVDVKKAMQCFIDVEKARRRRAMTTELTAFLDSFPAILVGISGLSREGADLARNAASFCHDKRLTAPEANMNGEIVRLYPVGEEWVVSFRRGLLTRHFATREAAEAFARETARKNVPSCLEIFERSGAVDGPDHCNDASPTRSESSQCADSKDDAAKGRTLYRHPARSVPGFLSNAKRLQIAGCRWHPRHGVSPEKAPIEHCPTADCDLSSDWGAARRT